MSRRKAFFHGTTHDIEPPPGSNVERIVPFASASQIHAEKGDEWAGHAKYPELYESEPWRMHHVYSTSDETNAWSWASGHGRQRVYEVEPEGEPEPEAYSTSDAAGEKISHTARVLGVQFTPPHEYARHMTSANWRAEPHGGVQGTLTGQDYRGASTGFDWSPYHDRVSELRRSQAAADEQHRTRATEGVKRQEALNNRGRQRRLFQ